MRKKGGVLISAHIGNFEIAEHFFADIDFDCQINLITTDQEVTVIKEYLESVAVKKSNIKFIYVKDDMSHIFEINDALSKNELICFTGDRYFEGSKFLEADLLGKSAKFPAGPFLIASRLRVPVVYVYVMKEKNLHYHLYARVAQNIKNRDSQGLLNFYVKDLESMLKNIRYNGSITSTFGTTSINFQYFYGSLIRLPLPIFFAKAFPASKKGFPLKPGCI